MIAAWRSVRRRRGEAVEVVEVLGGAVAAQVLDEPGTDVRVVRDDDDRFGAERHHGSTIGMCCQPAHRRRRRQLDAVVVDVPLGEAVEELVERDASLEPGERGAEAVVDAPPERQVPGVLAAHVELVGAFVATRIAVGRADQQQHRAARRHRGAVVVEVVGRRRSGGVAGGLEAKRLLDHLRDQRAIGDDITSLVGMLGEHLGQPPDEPSGGLVAGAGDDRGVRQHLFAGERALLAVFVLELGVEQARHQVVGRMLGAPVDVLGEHVAVGDLLLLHLHRFPASRAQVGVGLLAHRDLVVLGDAEQHADHAHRHHRRQFGDDVEPARADEGIEDADAVRRAPGPRARPSHAA